jgi:hypothetical protein
MKIGCIGIDLGKTTFHLVALGERGKVLIKRRFTRKQLLSFTANLERALIGLLISLFCQAAGSRYTDAPTWVPIRLRRE